MGLRLTASADLAKAVSLKPTDAYNVLWLHLARTREGGADATELQANAAKPNRAIWPGPLLDYFTGKADAATVLSKAGLGQGKAKATQLCEANLFLGQDDLAKGRKSEGLEKLQTAAKTCDGTSREARLIRADLQRSGLTAPKPVLTQAANTGPKAVPMPAGPTVRPVKPKPPAQAQAQASSQAAGDFSLRGSLK